MDFGAWCIHVVEAIEAEDEEMFKAAIKSCEEESDVPLPEPRTSQAVLEWMRGDEPQDAFDGGDSAQDYADFLLEEWELFGPQGE